jgi:hypothetical protein
MYIREGYTFVDSLRRDGYLILILILARFVPSTWKWKRFVASSWKWN